MVACSGEDSLVDSAAEQAATGPEEHSVEVLSPSITPQREELLLGDEDEDSIDAIAGDLYYRPADYPKSVDLPLQFITTKGGKQLSVRVTLPADEDGNPLEGPFPSVLTQSAYNTNLLSYMFMGTPGNTLMGLSDSYLVRRGYAQVAVDALGTGASEGGWELLGEDEQIGFADAVDWVHQQPWCNGKLGVAGVSYMAISSLFAAQRRPDSIDAIFASLPMGDAMRGTVGIGGMVNAVFMSEWMYLTHFLATQNLPAQIINPHYMTQLIETTKEHTDQVQRYHLPLIESALNGAPYVTYDGEFWRTRSPIENMDKIKAPTFFFGALNDIFQRDVPLLYEALKKNGVETRMVIFNGTHFINFVTSHIGATGVAPIDILMLQWFDKYLNNMETGTEDIPPVVQYVKNYPSKSTPQEFRGDHYATTTDWPHPQATAQRWYLHGDMSLSQTAPQTEESGPTMLNPPHPDGKAFESKGLIQFDVHIGDGTKCTRSFDQWKLGLTIPKSCFYNTEKTEQVRLLFESEPMQEDYYINGPIQADVWIDSTVTEAVVAVQIEEVSKKQSLPITTGQLLASGRAVNIERSRFMNDQMIQPYHYFTEEKSQPLVPGEVVKMQIEIFPTSTIIRKGNKLRVAISPSNQAQAMLNYPRQAMAEGGVTTLHISPEYPSSVVLPIVPTAVLD
nr:CocE/NonD family hydrolase [Ketobacter sp. MCCC 1A13808]